MPRETVAQHVRRNVLRAAVLLRPIIQPFGDLAAAQARAALRGEQRGLVRLGVALRQPLAQQCRAALRERHLALLITLAAHIQPARVQIHIRQVQTRQLRQPQAAAVQQLGDGLVAQGKRVVRLDGLVQQGVEGVALNGAGQPLRLFRRFDVLHGVGFQAALAHQIIAILPPCG